MGISSYIIIGLGIALAGTYGAQELRVRSLQGDKVALEESIQMLQIEKASAIANVARLRSELGDQNKAVEAMRVSRQEALNLMKEANQTADKYRALQQEAVARLAREAGTSCEEGIRLIDKELGL